MKKINSLVQVFGLICCFYIFIITALTPQSRTGLLQCFKLSNAEERQGCQAIILVKQTIDQLQKKIDDIKGKTNNTQKIIEEIKERKQAMQLIKRKFNIESLEIQKKLLEEDQEKIGYKIYGQTAELYRELDRLYTQITENREIKQIIKEIHKLEQEVQKNIQSTIREIQQIGKKIVQQTRITQNELNQFKREKLIPLEQKLTTRLLAGDIDQELDKVKIQIVGLNEQLSRELSISLTAQERAQITQLKNIIERLKIMLKSINNPEQLLDLTERKIVDLFIYP